MASPVPNNDLSQGRASAMLPEMASLRGAHSVKVEGNSQDTPAADIPTHSSRTTRLQEVIQGGILESLEAETASIQPLLENLTQQLVGAAEDQDAQLFLASIKTLQDEPLNTPTIIGVVGNTGAGKSAIINAVLEEEQLVPTNCMRACTAVVTEISWNSSNDENAKYRSEIEFIQPSDWEKELAILLAELTDPNGKISNEVYSAESEAAIAYAKIKAVYPNKTKDMLAKSSVAELMDVPEVKALLGTTKKMEKAGSKAFYNTLQYYIDSKEKTTGEPDKKDVRAKKTIEFWPLIKVVRIYTKADVLSTGAVIVDLPGVQDSNAARAAVAANYMKQCTGLWIVAPINRAVDDKVARTLLGDSFKRQLQYDGAYSRVTFICSKTDDVSNTEVARSLNLDAQLSADWVKIDEIDNRLGDLKKTVAELKDSKSIYEEQFCYADEEFDIWDTLKEHCENGKDVWPPVDKTKKRKVAEEGPEARKKNKGPNPYSDSHATDTISDDELGLHSSSAEKEPSPERGDPLTIGAIERKLSELRGIKRHARNERVGLDTKIKSLIWKIDDLREDKSAIQSNINAVCIKARNDYAKGAIQTDFAAGIKELDQENAQEEDEANFNPEEEIRNYEEVARSLPVFCCSARAYQKLSGRLLRDSAVSGFQSIEETGIPQLQQHCKHLTKGVRASNCRRYLTKCSQLINSLSLWAANDNAELAMARDQRDARTRVVNRQLHDLEAALESAVKDSSWAMKDTLEGNIFQNFDAAVQNAAGQALPIAQKWGSPINKANRASGGFAWGTYKALCRRQGVFASSSGAYDLNSQLAEPLIRNLASNWERAFARRLPTVLRDLNGKLNNLLTTFHAEVNASAMRQGVGVAGLAMLNQQNVIYTSLIDELIRQAMDMMASIQRDVNRCFTPVIAYNLISAYDTCVAYYGPGQFKRMKDHMESHVDTANVNMFTDSCAGVEQSLTGMSDQVTQFISSTVDEVFSKFSRDYTTFVSGGQLEHIVPEAKRQMRANIVRLIEGDDEAAPVANHVKKEPDSGTMEGGRRDQGMAEIPSRERTQIYEASGIKDEPDSRS